MLIKIGYSSLLHSCDFLSLILMNYYEFENVHFFHVQLTASSNTFPTVNKKSCVERIFQGTDPLRFSGWILTLTIFKHIDTSTFCF